MGGASFVIQPLQSLVHTNLQPAEEPGKTAPAGDLSLACSLDAGQVFLHSRMCQALPLLHSKEISIKIRILHVPCLQFMQLGEFLSVCVCKRDPRKAFLSTCMVGKDWSE